MIPAQKIAEWRAAVMEPTVLMELDGGKLLLQMGDGAFEFKGPVALAPVRRIALIAQAVPALLDERREAIAMLREIEFVDTSEGEYPAICHFCDQDDKHAPGCRLAAFLKETP